jgi:hypothetical protein
MALKYASLCSRSGLTGEGHAFSFDTSRGKPAGSSSRVVLQRPLSNLPVPGTVVDVNDTRGSLGTSVRSPERPSSLSGSCVLTGLSGTAKSLRGYCQDVAVACQHQQRIQWISVRARFLHLELFSNGVQRYHHLRLGDYDRYRDSSSAARVVTTRQGGWVHFRPR